MGRSCGIAAAVGLVCCGSDNSFSPLRGSDVFQQAPVDRVDILFVIDDSRSMAEEQQALADGFITFLAELDASETRWQIGVVSTTLETGDPEASRLLGEPLVLEPGVGVIGAFRKRVLQMGVDGSDKEQGLLAAARALEANRGFVRGGANLVIIFVTDEDDCSHAGALDHLDAVECYLGREALLGVPDLVQRIVRHKTQGEIVRFGGILGPPDRSCDAVLPGARYIEAVRQVGGTLGRICDGDWTPVLRELGVIAAGIQDQFELSEPANEDTLEVYVDEQPVPPDPAQGWTYDWQTWRLTFHGDAIPPRGSTIVVEYEVAPHID